MPWITHRFSDPDRFVVGTIGRPSERVFYMQVREDDRLVSVVCDENQVRLLAEHLGRLMDQITLVVEDTGDPGLIEVPSDSDPLDLPLMAEFRVGTMSIAWDIGESRLQVELLAVGSSPDETDEPDADGESVVILVPMAMGREFVARGLRLVEAAVPPCPLCNQPLDAEGHVCPRLNGYHTDAG